MGDFAVLKDLPEMFRHCKATEDRDLDVFEFFTEHVFPIGQLIEGTEHEPEEDGDKPHTPIHDINFGQITATVVSKFAFSTMRFYHMDVNEHSIHQDTFFASDYISKIFRPPIFA
jgi:hypothetical protein